MSSWEKIFIHFGPDDVTSVQFAQKHIFQNGWKKFLNSIYIIGCDKTPFYGDATHVGGSKNFYSLSIALFWPWWCHKWPICSKTHLPKWMKKFSQLDIYHRVWQNIILWRRDPCRGHQNFLFTLRSCILALMTSQVSNLLKNTSSKMDEKIFSTRYIS